ncbi:hypothetical protein [Micromonospora violae]|nr:hypothetical protein [Micromonospora violae]
MDSGEFDRMDELFCDEVVYDVIAFELGEPRGYEPISEASLAAGTGIGGWILLTTRGGGCGLSGGGCRW